MKKIVFLAVAVFAFVACNKTDDFDVVSDSTVADTTIVDTTIVDTIFVDSVVDSAK